MTRKTRSAIAAIIFVAVLSLTTFAQSSAWTRMMNQGISNVNDVDVGDRNIWITKTDGTIWNARDDQSNFVLFPAPFFAVRIAVHEYGGIVFVTTNDGRLFYRDVDSYVPPSIPGLPPPPIVSWQQISRPNSFVNDVALPHDVFQYNRLWISESFYPIASNNSVKYINAKNDVSNKRSPPQIGVISYADYFVVMGTFSGSFISTNSTGFSRVAAKYGRPLTNEQVWGVGSNGTVWHYDPPNLWTRTPALGMSNVVEGQIGTVWLAGQQQYNGTIWCSRDNGLTFRQDVGAQGFQNLAYNRHRSMFPLVAAGYNGTLWKRSWTPSPCSP